MPLHWLAGFVLRRRANGCTLSGVADRAAFRRQVDLAIARAARQQSSIAVLSFRVRPSDPVAPEVAKLVTGRVRTSDAVGWLGPDQLGVLLRHVEVEEALHVASELCNLLERQGRALRCTVYPYPPVPRVAAPEREVERVEDERSLAFTLESQPEPVLD